MRNQKRRVVCRRCERHRDECGVMSATGLCADCGRTAVEANIQGLHFKTGPALERWRRGMAASVGAQIVDNHGETG